MQRLMVVLDNVKAYEFKTLCIDDFSYITQIKLVLLLLLPFIIYFTVIWTIGLIQLNDWLIDKTANITKADIT